MRIQTRPNGAIKLVESSVFGSGNHFIPERGMAGRQTYDNLDKSWAVGLLQRKISSLLAVIAPIT